MQLAYLPSGAQDANRQTSGVLLFQAALGQIVPAYRRASLLSEEKKNDGVGLHRL